MFRLRNRSLLLVLSLVLAVAVGLGCSTREDPGETLAISGNHSSGDLVMVTTDTSSEGYHYLAPQLSPDGSRILFTADWFAYPSHRPEGDEDFTVHRQLILIPLQVGIEPTNSLEDQDADLIVVSDVNLYVSGEQEYQADCVDRQKGDPIWVDDQTIIHWMSTSRVGYRLFSADVSNPALCSLTPLYMEDSDALASPPQRQHMEPALSPDGRWLAFTRSGCVIPDSFETCTGLTLMVMDLSTAGADNGYGTTTFPVTHEYSRIETPRWHPESNRLIFSGGMDVAGMTGAGTELFTVDLDTTGLGDGTMVLDNNLQRLTYTEMADGDPIAGIQNTSPAYSTDGNLVYFTSSRRAPTTTLHDRNIWRMTADGLTSPEIHYFTRSDDQDPFFMADGRILLSSALGFPTEMLDRLEEETYQKIVIENEEQDLGLDEVQMRDLAAEERRNLEYFEGVMFHLYTFRP